MKIRINAKIAASSLNCPKCKQDLGKDTENPNPAYCDNCGQKNIRNPRGERKSLPVSGVSLKDLAQQYFEKYREDDLEKIVHFTVGKNLVISKFSLISILSSGYLEVAKRLEHLLHNVHEYGDIKV